MRLILYAPPTTGVDDQTLVLAFLNENPFAMVCINGPHGPLVAYTPMIVERDVQGHAAFLVGHIAKANPLHNMISEAGTEALVVFKGLDAYVSPALYPSKAAHGRVVPTWNYIAAEARGRLFIERQADAMHGYLTPLTEHMERHRPEPWAIHDAPSDYVANLTQAIVGLRLRISALEGKRKLSQNRNHDDFNAVHAALAASLNPAEQALAREMRKERP